MPGKVQPLGGAPEPLEIVELPRALTEDMHNQIAVVEQDPFRAGFPLPMRQANALAPEALFDGVANGLNLRVAASRSEQKIFGESAVEFQDSDIQGLFFLGRFDCPANFGMKVFQFHRYKACPRMYSTTGAGTSPWIPFFSSRRSRTSVDETWLATVASKCMVDLRSTILSDS